MESAKTTRLKSELRSAYNTVETQKRNIGYLMQCRRDLRARFDRIAELFIVSAPARGRKAKGRRAR